MSSALSSYAAALGGAPDTYRSSRYAAFIAFGFFALFYSNLPTYGGMFLWSAQPIHFVMLLGLAMFPLLIGRDGLRIDLRSPFVVWCLVYLLICSSSYSFLAGGAPEPFKLRILAVCFMLAFYFLFVHATRFLVWVRYALIGCVLLGVVMNVYDISHPFALVPSTSEFSLIGRASGLYVNPNSSGLALLMGFVLSIELIRPRWRPLYLFIVCIGLALTASRAAIVGLGLVTLLLTLNGVLRVRQLVGMALAVAAVGWYFWSAFGNELAAADVNWTALYERASWFMELGGTADFSQRERAVLAEKALALAADNPFLGGGLGSTELWNERSSTHNMYLMTMADFGLLGVLIFPALVWASAGGIAKMFRRESLIFSCLALWAGMVSHNLIGDYYFMLALALMAAQSDAGRGQATTICPSLVRTSE